ncbi:LysR family transcriptional regulator [Acinetobacter nectaris]|uniref:LysR family transcriptional regulator n=1 Tax=Acinetobacter nectaris TaxID=1219382 RepID=UPI001F396596|nr:LysR family transcriptional regulator [Acinetobacter nectaris]MCF8998416.1 LysR family transcriptional regulator [Acinetobacter nectaris]MCF9027534.1 LysR family transcriptional regulator [Acinetobacter nectaris]
MDKLKSISVFVKVAELGSYAKVANILNMSPQMVAKHISYLEYHLNTVLIIRTTRKQTLTHNGIIYYESCIKILKSMNDADDLMKELNHSPRGVLRVNAPTTFGVHQLPLFLTKFMKKYKNIKIELILDDQLVELADNKFDIVIRIGDYDNAQVSAVVLQPYELMVCAAPEYLKSYGDLIEPTDLESHKCLLHSAADGPSLCSWNFMKNNITTSVVINDTFRSSNWNVLLNTAIHGLGIVLGPKSILDKEIKEGRLVQVLKDFTLPLKPMNAIFLEKSRSIVRVKVFLEELEKAFPK